MSNESSGVPHPAAMVADQGVLVGYPVSRTGTYPLVIGTGARLRSGTVLYDGTTIGTAPGDRARRRHTGRL